jgi:hypothetical protein
MSRAVVSGSGRRPAAVYDARMPGSIPLTAQQVARLSIYDGWHPDEVAEFLSGGLGYLPEREATRVAYEAFLERLAVEDDEQEWLDEEARRAEHDVRPRRPRERVLPRTPDNERAVAEALQAATVFHAAAGLTFERLCRVVQGAFLLPQAAAALVAEEAIEQAARLDERTG